MLLLYYAAVEEKVENKGIKCGAVMIVYMNHLTLAA